MITRSCTARALVLGVMMLALIGPTITGMTCGAAAQISGSGPTAEPVETVPTALAVDQRTGDVFVVSGAFGSQTGGAAAAGVLSVLQTRHGRIRRIRTVMVGYGPSTVLVDERAGRVLVLNVGGGNKYAGFTGGNVSVLDMNELEKAGPSRQVLVRRTPLGRQLPRVMAIDRMSGRAFVANWTLRASSVFTQVPTGSVSVLDTRSGALLHTVNVGSAAEAVATDEALSRAFVLLGGQVAGPRMSVLDARTGAVVQTFGTGPGRGPIAVDGHTGRLFVGTPSAVQVRTALSGALERTVNVGQGPVAFAVDEQRGHIFVQIVAYSSSSSASGSVSMLDARSGALLGTARVGAPNPFAQYLIGGTPQTLVIDEQSGHILAANSATMGANRTAIAHNSVSILAPQGRALRVLRTIALSAAPVAIATDSPTGHAFVITTMMSSAGPSKPGVSMLDLRTGNVVGVVSL